MEGLKDRPHAIIQFFATNGAAHMIHPAGIPADVALLISEFRLAALGQRQLASDSGRDGRRLMRIPGSRRAEAGEGTDETNLGRVLKAARMRCGLTQEQLGSQSGATAAHLAHLENDQRQPSLELLSRLAQALQLAPDKLFLLAHPEARALFRGQARSRPRRDQAWRAFIKKKELLARYNVQPHELKFWPKPPSSAQSSRPMIFFSFLIPFAKRWILNMPEAMIWDSHWWDFVSSRHCPGPAAAWIIKLDRLQSLIAGQPGRDLAGS